MISQVYFNFHKKCWSIRQRGIVVAHDTSLVLYQVSFRVSEAGRQRVLREQRKNVHAFAAGILQTVPLRWEPVRQISYNPYKAATFVDKDGMAVYEANLVLFKESGQVYEIKEVNHGD